MKTTYVNVAAEIGAATASLEAKEVRSGETPENQIRDLLVMGEKRFMNVEELSAYLGISKWLVYKFVKDREIPFIPFGRLVRFDRLAVEKWAEKRMVRGFKARAV